MKPKIILVLLFVLGSNDSLASPLMFEYEIFGIDGQGQMLGFDINNHNEIVGLVDYFGSGARKPSGFMRTADGITIIDPPGTQTLNGSRAYGINDRGQVVGRFLPDVGSSSWRGYIWEDGDFTELTAPNAVATEAHDVNNSGEIVGRVFFKPIELGPSAFILDSAGYSVYRPDDLVGNARVSFEGINDQGNVVGRITDDLGARAFAIIDGMYLPFSIADLSPNIFSFNVSGINNRNQIVGSFSTGLENHGFLMDSSGIYQIDVPGAGFRGSGIGGINDRGFLTGFISQDRFPVSQAILASPCRRISDTCIEAPRIANSLIDFPTSISEPGTGPLLAIGLLVLTWMRRLEFG